MKYKELLKNNFGLIIYVSIVAFTTIFFISSLYIGGVTIDEIAGVQMLTTHFRILENNIPLDTINPGNQALVYYGIIHLLPAYFLSLLTGDFYPISHVTFFIMSLIASYYLYRIALLCGLRSNFAYLTASLLLIFPLWLGHSFFNDKDIPGGVFFTIYSYYVCKAIALRQKNEKLNKNLIMKLIISAALLAGVKFAFFPIVVLNTTFITLLFKSDFKAKLSFFMVAIVGTLIVTLIFLPGSWHQPLTYILNEFTVMGNFPWTGCTLFFNECIGTTSPQWNTGKFLLKWYLVETPLIYFVLFIFGCISITRIFLSDKSDAKWLIIIILIQLAVLPVLAIIHNSIMYDRTRHTIFSIPALVLLCGFGLDYIYNIHNTYLKKTIYSVSISLLMGLIIDNILLNPYQYIYYNEISRVFVTDKNSYMDGWQFSTREAFEKINMNRYYAPYVSLVTVGEFGLMPYKPYIGEANFVKYDKNMAIPPNVSINVFGTGNLQNAINPNRCLLVSSVYRSLLFKSEPFLLSSAYHCE